MKVHRSATSRALAGIGVLALSLLSAQSVPAHDGAGANRTDIQVGDREVRSNLFSIPPALRDAWAVLESRHRRDAPSEEDHRAAHGDVTAGRP